MHHHRRRRRHRSSPQTLLQSTERRQATQVTRVTPYNTRRQRNPAMRPIFDILAAALGGRDAPRGSMIILFGRALDLICSHRLSKQTIVISGTVQPQFVMPLLTAGCDPQFGGRARPPGWSQGLEMGPLSSLVVTSYRLPIVTIGLSLTVFAVLRLVADRRTDRRIWSSKRWHCTKVHQPPKIK